MFLNITKKCNLIETVAPLYTIPDTDERKENHHEDDNQVHDDDEECLSKMKVKEIKHLALQIGVDISKCFEELKLTGLVSWCRYF